MKLISNCKPAQIFSVGHSFLFTLLICSLIRCGRHFNMPARAAIQLLLFAPLTSLPHSEPLMWNAKWNRGVWSQEQETAPNSTDERGLKWNSCEPRKRTEVSAICFSSKHFVWNCCLNSAAPASLISYTAHVTMLQTGLTLLVRTGVSKNVGKNVLNIDFEMTKILIFLEKHWSRQNIVSGLWTCRILRQKQSAHKDGV